MNLMNFLKKLFGNPYDAYLNLDYDKLTEKEMMQALDGVFNIDPTIKNGLFDQTKHYAVVELLIRASIKLKYTSVCEELRKIYPLSYSMWEKSYPKRPFEDEKKIESMANIAPPMMIEIPLEEQKERLKGSITIL